MPNKRTTFYLIFTRGGVDRLVKTTSKKPDLKAAERSVLVTMEFDEAIFSPPPGLVASFQVGAHQTNANTTVTLDPQAAASGTGPDRAQSTLNSMAARMFQEAINGSDDRLREFAVQALAACKEAGVVVTVNLPE